MNYNTQNAKIVSITEDVYKRQTVYHYSNVLLGLADNDEEFRLTMRKGDAPQIDNKAEGNIGGRIINAQAQNFWKKLQQINQPAGDRTPVMVELSNRCV